MKILDQSVSLLPQQPGVVGMYKHIEICGRVSWKSEDHLTDDSWKKFIKFLYGKGHWGVFNLGTAYLKVPKSPETYYQVEHMKETKPFSRVVGDGDYYYITTNFRVLCQLRLTDWVEKYWCDPLPSLHSPRVTVHWVVSRGIGEEIIRHRTLSFVKESTRYINYSQDRRGGELQYIIPQYAYQLRDEIAQTNDPLTGESMSWIQNEVGEKLWRSLTVLDRWAASRDNFWMEAERQYIYETTEMGVAPEIARGSLPLDVKGEFYSTGWVDDFYYEPPTDSPEQAGFFKLRCAKACHRDLRPLAIRLKELMDLNYPNLIPNAGNS